MENGHTHMISLFINSYLKILFILTPFFVLSAFLVMTKDLADDEKKRTARRVTWAVMISSFVFYLFGRYIFELFGITLDAFRIGAGAVLFLSSLTMIHGKESVNAETSYNDIAVVPLAMPITVGPGVIGVMMVFGAEAAGVTEELVISLSLFLAVMTVGMLLYISGKVKNLLGKQGLNVLTKVTGLFVAAIAAQIIFTGIRNFFA